MRELPSHWIWVDLGQLMTPVPVRRVAKDAPVLTFRGLRSDGTLELAPSETGSFATAMPGDIVFTKQGHVGGWVMKKVGRIPEGVGVTHVAGTLLTIRANDLVDSSFLYLWMSSPELYERVQLLVGERNGITNAILESIPVPLPPLDEQRRIVAILEDHLSRLDAGVALLARIKRQVQSLRSSWEERLIASAGGESEALGALATDVRYGTSDRCSATGLGPLVLRIPNVVGGSVSTDDAKFASYDSVGLQAQRVEVGDLLVIRTNGSRDLVGRSAVVPEGVEASFASYLIRIRVDATRVDPYWVQWILDSSRGRRQIDHLARSSAGQHNVNSASLKALGIPLPSLDSQREALNQRNEVRSSTARTLAHVDASSGRSPSLKYSLLQAAFSGQLTKKTILV